MRLILLVATALAAAPGIVTAQTSSDVEWTMFVGSRVRLTSQGLSSERTTGRLVSGNRDSVTLWPADVEFPRSIKTSSITRVEVFRGSSAHKLKGLLIGFAAGAIIAGGLTAATWHPAGEIDFGRWGDAGIIAIPGGLAGGLIGLLAGAVPRERWQEIPIPDR